MSKNDNKKIFLSYSFNDKQQVQRVKNLLTSQGLNVYTDLDNLPAGANWDDEIKLRLESSDFVLLFLSKTVFERDGLRFEYTQDFLENFRKRDITLIPVRLDNSPIPSNLHGFEIFNLAENFDAGANALVERIKNIREITFDHLTPRDFENLIYELLNNLRFTNIQREQKVLSSEIDFIAEFYATDPFGQKEKETWVVETKFYKESRFDIKAIQKVVESYKYISTRDAKLLLITNSQFTSVVKNFLENIKNSEFIDIKTIDGFQLKNMLATRPELINKYFNA